MIQRAKNETKAEAIERAVAEYERSGLTRRKFSEKAGIAVSTLDYWRRRVHGRDEVRIVPVTIEPDSMIRTMAGCAGFQVNLPNGVRIESGWDFPEQGMARLLRLAAER